MAIVLLLAVIATGGWKACEKPTNPTTREVKSKLDTAANYLNAAAKTNRELYEQNVINIAERRVVAGRINQANGYLKLAIERAAQLKPCSSTDPEECRIGFTEAQSDVLVLLGHALSAIEQFKTGNAKLDATLAAVGPLIREAISLVQAFKEIAHGRTEIDRPVDQIVAISGRAYSHPQRFDSLREGAVRADRRPDRCPSACHSG